MKDSEEYNVRAVERALQILSCFSDEHPERGISDIALAVGLHKATTHRIVTTLVNYGYLERAPDGLKYRLGLELITLGYRSARRMDLRREAYPYMEQLVLQWDETCDLSIFDHREVFYIEVLKGNHALSIAAAVGQRLPAHATASGKLFLAYLPAHELDEILSRPLKAYTENTITSPAELRNRLQAIRQQGYAIDDEEAEAGIRAISAPICNQRGDVIAAMSIPSPTSRMTTDRIPQMAEALKEVTQAISRRLGCDSI
jgi:IclR family KDG regulon transcriptional repressor